MKKIVRLTCPAFAAHYNVWLDQHLPTSVQAVVIDLVSSHMLIGISFALSHRWHRICESFCLDEFKGIIWAKAMPSFWYRIPSPAKTPITANFALFHSSAVFVFESLPPLQDESFKVIQALSHVCSYSTERIRPTIWRRLSSRLVTPHETLLSRCAWALQAAPSFQMTVCPRWHYSYQ